jgi:Piwi domain
MTSTPNSSKCAGSFLAEVSLLKDRDPDRPLNFTSYRLPPNLDLEIGKKLSYRLARYFPNVAVIWHESIFHILTHLDGKIPSLDEWNNALQDIRQQLGIESGWGKLCQIKNSQPTAKIIALLAREILYVNPPFSVKQIPSDNKVKVCRRARVGYEILSQKDVESQKDIEYPALSITIHSPITSVDNLADFIKKHPYRQELETLLVKLEVETRDNNSKATIVEIVGTMSEYRKQLIDKATGGSSRQAIATAPDEEPVVAIKFNNRGDKYYYALAVLSPLITAKTADQLELDWGKLTQATKIDYAERQELLTKYKDEANKALSPYGIMLDRSIGKKISDDDSLFWTPAAPIENTKLEFGQNKIQPYTAILKGLTEGGIYRRSKQFTADRPISIVAIDLIQSDLPSDGFMVEVGRQLAKFRCKFTRIDDLKSTKIRIEHLDSPKGRAELDERLEDLSMLTPDLAFIFLPQTDRERDDEDGGSLYYRIYEKLLNRGIATQFIYEQSLRTETRHILNQVMPGVLAKLGHLPFVLAESLTIADVFIGLDVSRKTKLKLSGTTSACAGVCFYGKQGEFLRAKSEDGIIEGEEIPRSFLEKLLPAPDIKGKTVAIYRDGRFCGNEARYLADWGAAIGAKFILIECCKSGCPRLYNLSNKRLQAPDRGVALRLSDREAILVTTKVTPKIGVPRPIRLSIRPEGHQVAIEEVLETTLKLTLLHYGALKPPKLPVMLHGADRLATLRLRGIYLVEMFRQFWL